ncbi:derlin 1 [Phyllostomus discolor]|uniref:Derlin n=1 Tax=Phyllostomus discolor TaxID=89673 RepID=A0A834E0K3_9CHIR|nr:derlin 1 [Phyllostomus discolor]
MSDIGDWFRSIPAITRYWFAATVAVPLVGKLGLISPAYFVLWPEAFLYRFQACYLPWVILGFNYIIGGSVINELIGNLVGHLYFFLMFRYPMDLGGRNFLSTPQFLYRWLPSRRGGVSGFGVPPASVRRAADQNGGGGRHHWGQGFRLGDQ